MTRDELIALLQQRRNNDVIVYVPCDEAGSLTFQVEGVDYDETTDCILIDTEQLTPDEVTFAEADDRRGFIVHVNGEQVGEPVGYDGYGWSGIDATMKLVVELTKALGGTVVKSEATA